MMQQSDGSRPDPKEFAQGYAATVGDFIEKLKRYREPSEGERALAGAEGMALNDPNRQQNYAG